MKKWNNNTTVVEVGLGQLLSLLFAFTAFTSSQLANKGIYAPFSLSLLSHLLLVFIYGGIMFYRRETFKGNMDEQGKVDKVGLGVCAGVFDAVAHLIRVKAKENKFTCLTSVMVLNCWTIPCVVLLTCFFLKTKYTFRKLVGVTICTAAFVTFIFSYLHYAADTSSAGKDDFVGDLVIIVGATSFGVGNVIVEFIVKVNKVDHVQLMAFLGLYGAFLLAFAIAVFERNELKSIYTSISPETIFSFIGFCLAMFLFYSGVPILLKISGSTMLSLSLLTSDMWAVLIRIFAYHQKVDWIYFVAFVVVTLGLIVYSWGDQIDVETDEFKRFDEEANACHPEKCGITIKNWWNNIPLFRI